MYPQVGHVLAECLIMPANYAVGNEDAGNRFMMWHDCDNLEEQPKEELEEEFVDVLNPETFEQAEKKMEIPKKPCTCSLLDLFFRNSLHFNKKDREIGEILQILFSNYSLKKQMAIGNP